MPTLNRAKPHKMMSEKGGAFVVLQNGFVFTRSGAYVGPAPSEGLASMAPSEIMEHARGRAVKAEVVELSKPKKAKESPMLTLESIKRVDGPAKKRGGRPKKKKE